MTKRLNGKVALVTGASAGIGAACARALAVQGATIVLTARRQQRLDALANDLRRDGGTALTIAGDAREESTARDAVALATSKAGRLDILINNAGVGNYKNLVDTSADDYDEMMDSNMRSTFLF